MVESAEAELPFTTFCGRPLRADMGTVDEDGKAIEVEIVRAMPVHIFTVDCGLPVGEQNITCGPGYYGTQIEFSCPIMYDVPTCRFWDEQRGRWAGDGCTVHSVDNSTGAVTCACTHLTDFGVRFAALAQQQQEMFTLATMLGDSCIFEYYPLLFIMIGSLACTFVGLICISYVADATAAVKYYTTLLQDEEVIFMKKVAKLRGKTFMLDRQLDNWADSRWAFLYSCCIPRIRRTRRGVTTPARAHIAIQATAQAGAGASKESAPVQATLTGRLQALLQQKRHAKAEACKEIAAVNARIAAAGQAPPADSVGNKFGASMYIALVESYDTLRVSADVTTSSRDGLDLSDEDMHVTYPPLLVAGMWVISAASYCSLLASAYCAAARGRCTCKRKAPEKPAVSGTKAGDLDSALSVKTNPLHAGRAAAPAGSLPYLAGEAAGDDLASLEKALEGAQEVLTARLSWSCVRPWNLKWFLIRLWGLRLLYFHPLLSIFFKYDPTSPRTIRLMSFMVEIFTALWATCFLFAFREGYAGDMGSTSEVWDFGTALFVAFFATLIQMPIGFVIESMLGGSAEAEYSFRYEALTVEVEAREEAAKRLRKLTLQELEARVHRLRRLQLELGFLKTDVEGGTTKDSALLQDGDTVVSGEEKAKLESSGAPVVVSAATEEAQEVQAKSMLHERIEDYSDAEIEEEGRLLGWRDAPPGCVRWLGWLVALCRRHPLQKRAWVAKKLRIQQRKMRKAAKKAEAKRSREERSSRGLPPLTQAEKAAGGGVRGAAALTLTLMPGAAQDQEGGDKTDAREGGDKDEEDGDDDDEEEEEEEDEGLGLDELFEELAALSDPYDVAFTLITFVWDTWVSGWIASVIGWVLWAMAAVVAAARGIFFCCKSPAADAPEDDGKAAAAEQARAATAAAQEMAAKEPVKERTPVHPLLQRVLEGLSMALDKPATLPDSASGDGGQGGEGVSTEASQAAAVPATEASVEEWLESELEVQEEGPDATRADCARRIGCPMGLPSLWRISVVLTWTAFVLWYVLLLGIWQSETVVQDLLISFSLSTFISLFIIAPGMGALVVLWSFSVWPAWLPYLAWLPRVGRLFLGPHAAVAGAAPDSKLPRSVLTGRLQNVAFVRAAGAASALTPDSAILAYGVAAAVTGLINGRANKPEGAADAGDESGGEVTSQYQQALAVQCYALEQALLAQAHYFARTGGATASCAAGTPGRTDTQGGRDSDPGPPGVPSRHSRPLEGSSSPQADADEVQAASSSPAFRSTFPAIRFSAVEGPATVSVSPSPSGLSIRNPLSARQAQAEAVSRRRVVASEEAEEEDADATASVSHEVAVAELDAALEAALGGEGSA